MLSCWGKTVLPPACYSPPDSQGGHGATETPTRVPAHRCVQYVRVTNVYWSIVNSEPSRRGNTANHMMPPSPDARDAHSPSRERDSPSSSNRSVPGYMQPTKSSLASKGPGTPRSRKISDKKRKFNTEYFL